MDHVSSQESRILIIDDQPSSEAQLDKILTGAGYKTIKTTNQIEAVNICYDQEIDAILLEPNLPASLEICQQIQEYTNIPILMITDGIDASELASANDYISRPIDANQVLIRVKNAVQLCLLKRQLDNQTLEFHQLMSHVREIDNRIQPSEDTAALENALGAYRDEVYDFDLEPVLNRIQVSSN